MANEKLGMATEPSPESLYRLGGLYACAVGLDILKFEQTSLFYCASYLNSWGGCWSFVSEGLSPSKPSMATGCMAKLQFALLGKVIMLCDMSSLQDMSNFLLISMTGPKVAQCIHMVSILLHEAKPVLGILCLHLNTFGWVVMCKSVVLKKKCGNAVPTPNKEEGYTK